MFGFTSNAEHTYSFACTGMKLGSKLFSSRQAANQYMYSICDKYGLKINEVWDDNHDKTYIADGNVRFYIQRAY